MKKSKIMSFLKGKLSTDKDWALKALLRLMENQTNEELMSYETNEKNNVGFTGADAYILTSIGNYYKDHKSLSTKQMNVVFKLIPKYWNQIWQISNQNAIVEMINEKGN